MLNSGRNTASTGQGVAILLPAFDEVLNVEETILRFHQALPDASIYLINNGSTDNTGKVAAGVLNRQQIAGAVINETQTGKGHAIRRGLAVIKADIYVLCDVDLTYPIEDVGRLIAPVVQQQADMVIGDRLSDGTYKKREVRRFHYQGNRFFNGLFNLLFRQDHRDLASGFKVMSAAFLSDYKVRAGGFDVEVDLVLHAVLSNKRVLTLPISYQPRCPGSISKLNTLRDGTLYLKTILVRFIQIRIFGLL